jgi:hypothetical protein
VNSVAICLNANIDLNARSTMEMFQYILHFPGSRVFQAAVVVVVAVIDDFNRVTYHVSLNQFG